jgi:NAD(P)-dependent dehydrogenase (short-subunit alcohol dehydrogenase family)
MVSQVVLITGALTGIGRATAFAFARLGAKVMVSGRREEAGLALATELRALGGEAEFFKADVREEDDVAALVKKTVARFGRLDVAVNNAGTEGTPSSLTDITLDAYNTTFDTNVLGVLLSLKHELAVMVPQGSGSIVNVSSIAGHVGMAGASVYVASKHAVEGLTKSAALEVAGTGVRVNAVSPGPVVTDMLERFVGRDQDAKAGFLGTVPLGRAGTVEEIADAIVYLSTGSASFITGHSLILDGGYTVR